MCLEPRRRLTLARVFPVHPQKRPLTGLLGVRIAWTQNHTYNNFPKPSRNSPEEHYARYLGMQVGATYVTILSRKIGRSCPRLKLQSLRGSLGAPANVPFTDPEHPYLGLQVRRAKSLQQVGLYVVHYAGLDSAMSSSVKQQDTSFRHVHRSRCVDRAIGCKRPQSNLKKQPSALPHAVHGSLQQLFRHVQRIQT